MYYINSVPTENGNYGNPQSNYVEGKIGLPDEMISDYIAAKGFITFELADGIITTLSINQQAYDAYEEAHPYVPEPDPEPTMEEVVNALLGVEK